MSPYKQTHITADHTALTCRLPDGEEEQKGASVDPADKDPFPPAPAPPADDESTLEAAATLDEASERPAELNDIWWRRLDEVPANPPPCKLHVAQTGNGNMPALTCVLSGRV